MTRPKCYGAISGGGPRGTFLAGAAAALDASCEVLGWSGASIGAIVAALKAFGMPDDKILALFVRFLDGGLIDVGFGGLTRGGILDWRAIGDAVDVALGPKAKLGDAVTPLVIGVTSLDEGCPWYLSKREHPQILVREALTASSSFMAGVTPAAVIPSLGTTMSPDVRLWADGGYTDNTVDHVWDAKTSPRVLLRLAGGERDRVYPGEAGGIAGAVLRATLWSQSQPKSKRDDGMVVEVPSSGGWDFKKSRDDVNAEWTAGYDATRKQLVGFVAGVGA